MHEKEKKKKRNKPNVVKKREVMNVNRIRKVKDRKKDVKPSKRTNSQDVIHLMKKLKEQGSENAVKKIEK